MEASKVVSIPSVNKGDSQSASKIISELSTDAAVIVFSGTHTKNDYSKTIG